MGLCFDIIVESDRVYADRSMTITGLITMANEIVRQDLQSLIDDWIEMERNGTEYPVPFESAWTIAGYSRKDSAKRYLPKSALGKLYHVSVVKTKGRPKDVIMLSTEGMKHICLMADTAEGEVIRRYFIDAEKKWKLVGQVSPEFAQNIEILKLKIELAKQEAIKATADEATISIRQFVATTCPEAVQQKILGYSVVEKIEYRDRIIHNNEIIRSGSTINKTEMCRRLGLTTRNGSSNYKALNRFLESSRLPSEAWELTATIRENEELKAEYWPEVQSRFLNGDRNYNIGE